MYEYLKEKELLSSTIFFTPTRPLKCMEFIEEFDKYCKLEKCPPAELITKDELLNENIITYTIYTHYDLSNIEIPGLKNGIDFIIKKGGNYEYDVTPPGGNKAEGLKILMEHLGEDPTLCAFIGDNENDIDIMKLSNLSFAVGNANDYVKSYAKYTLDITNHEAAVAKAITLIYQLQ